MEDKKKTASFDRRNILLGGTALVAASAVGELASSKARAQQTAIGRKPNILMIMADDIGWFNLSAYNLGVMGYRTPNIDRIAKEGALFTDWYGEQSCTAGRAAFITGQSPIRTGLTKVGLPGADIGLHAADMSVAEALKPLGYATGQFGKNHLGDRNEYLPTVHGFDEFFGNLYHLNAEEEPQNSDYPKDAKFRARFGPRGVLKCRASENDDATIDPSYGRVGKQVIENTGSLDTKRMETVDEEFIGAAIDFIDRKHKANTPWFCYFNPTRMHVWTHLKPASDGKTKLGVYPDGMVELDGLVGQLLKKLDDLGIADNTIVLFTSDNGAEVMSWPDGGTTPFRGEKATNWEGAYRVPMVIRWPGTIKPSTVYNEMCSHYDFDSDFCCGGRRP
ncbi:arylsulfatase A-like enzyme [Bradyrhizobium sp. F1.13.4]